MKKSWFYIVPVLTFLLMSCSENKSQQSNITTVYSTQTDPLTASTSFKKGDVVPRNEVCMVNNAFM